MMLPASTEPSPSDSALLRLELAQKRYESAKAARITCAQDARAHGLTYRQMANILDMTDAGVRMMLKRAGVN